MTDSIPKKPLKKGSLVFVDRENYIKSIEALASDDDLPNYVFEGPGEILSVKDAYHINDYHLRLLNFLDVCNYYSGINFFQ